MARTKAFESDTALAEAMALFWERGYEATSIRDLTAQTGLSSSSLYATFGDKHAVYLAALARYREREVGEMRRRLAADRPLRETMRAIATEIIDTLLADEERRGSFTLNAAVELGGHDPAVSAQLRAHFEDIRALLAERLRDAQAHGEIALSNEPDALAHYLLFGFYSLALMVKVYPERARLEQTAKLVLAALDCM
jgi:TetR/AcrR family transcriptional repressor of nem operon